MSTAQAMQTVQSLTMGYWASRCIQVIAEIGVADILGEEPQTAEALAAALGVKAGPLGRVLRCLVNHGVFTLRDERFSHNAASRLLVDDGSPSLRSLVRMMGLKAHWAAYGELDVTLRTGEPGIALATGGSFFDHLAADPAAGRVFDEAMAGRAFGHIAPVLAAYDFSGFRTIADIGGGSGHLLAAVLEKVPHAQGVLFDLPAVAARAAERPHPRARYIGGDFFKDPIPPCDAYMLMTVLHDWSDAEAVQILAAIRRAAPPNAKLLLLEAVIGQHDDGYDVAIDLDIEMLVMTTGRERSKAEWTRLLADGGFRLGRVIPMGGASAIIEGEPA